MLDADLFVSDTLHERSVSLPGGKSVSLRFRELPAVAFIRFHAAQASGDEDAKAGAIARIIAESVVNDDGTAAMSYEKALTLKPGPLNAIFGAILDINGAGVGNG